MANKRDFYEVLGVNKNASKDEIKSAYRKLAKTYHPDNKETGNEAKFKEIQEAYDILYDDQKRSAYDQFGFAAFEQAGGNPGANPFEGGFSGFGGSSDIFGDIFSSFFGGGSRRQQRSGPRRGNDRIITMNLDFMDAINGGDFTISLNVDEMCPKCQGTGAKSPSSIKTCSQCGGRGYIRSQRRTILGVMESQDVCPTCGGNGKTISEKCPDCSGKGYVRKKKEVDVKVTAGINTGQQIVISGYGERGYNGGPNGNLIVEVNVKPHQVFQRDGNDIHIQLPLDFADAALGTKVSIPTVYGEVELTIPSGTQPGQVLKMRGQGVKDMRSGRSGDQYVHVKVTVPTSLSKEQRTLLEQFKKATPKSESESFIERVKKMFKKN
ncbi:MAG: molecular chaperone DnaJ [Bacilli bacterium]|nr:molecular chaperone DnaJ [Bacilli bacterium]